MSDRHSTSECELNSGSYNAKIEDSRDGSNYNPSQGQAQIICSCMKEDLNVKYENIGETYPPNSLSGSNSVYHHHPPPHHSYAISTYPKIDELPIGSYYSPYGSFHGTYADYPEYLSRKHAAVDEHKKDTSHYPIPTYHKYESSENYQARGAWLQHPPAFAAIYDEHYIVAPKSEIYTFPPVIEKKKRGRKPDEKRVPGVPKQRGRRKNVTDEAGGEGQSNRTPKRSLEFNSYIMRMEQEDLDKLKELITVYANKNASVSNVTKTEEEKKDVFKTEYSLLEDLNLVYAIAASGKQLGKKLFLDIMNSKVCGERTDSSMRLRYKFNLGALTKENLQEIFEYVNKNGPQGFLSFKTSTDGMKYFQRVEKEFKGPARPEFKGHTSKSGIKQEDQATKRPRAKRSLGHELDNQELEKKGEPRPDGVGVEPKEVKKGRKKRQTLKVEPPKFIQQKEYIPMSIPYERAPKFKLEIRREGSFDAGDRVERVESVVGELEDDLEFLVIWQEKLPGIRPKESKLPGKLIRVHDPRALLDYYTKNIIITKPLD